MTIWAFKDLLRSAVTKIEFKGYVISVAMDDSCGAFKHFERSDIRIYFESVDVTNQFLIDEETYIRGNAENLFRIMTQINDKSS